MTKNSTLTTDRILEVLEETQNTLLDSFMKGEINPRELAGAVFDTVTVVRRLFLEESDEPKHRADVPVDSPSPEQWDRLTEATAKAVQAWEAEDEEMLNSFEEAMERGEPVEVISRATPPFVVPAELREFKERVQKLINRCSIPHHDRTHWRVEVSYDRKNLNRVYLQVRYWRPDVITGVYDWGSGGKRYLSEHMTDSEIVRQLFAAYMAYDEHELRELFKFDGKAIFGPHIDITQLHRVAHYLDVRS